MSQLELFEQETDSRIFTPRSRGRIRWTMHELINMRGYCKRLHYLFPHSMYSIHLMLITERWEEIFKVAYDPYYEDWATDNTLQCHPVYALKHGSGFRK